MKLRKRSIVSAVLSTTLGAFAACTVAAEEETTLLWGDTHLHTSYSFDAYLNGNFSGDPDTAYRWAKGQPVIHPENRTRIQIGTPLDFLVVADHAELMGFMRAVNRGTDQLSDMGPIDSFKRWLAINHINGALEDNNAASVFIDLLPEPGQNPGGDPVADPANEMSLTDPIMGDTTAIEQTAWNEITDAADRHNDPGKFTAFIGWEWSSIPTGANLHRIVISPSDGTTAKKYLPYGSDQSQYPEDLWNWLDKTEAETGAEFIAIPHNSNISKGYMFAETTLKGRPITADYAARRVKREPLAEITQFKGDSETHPNVSPQDEFADFETYEFHIQKTMEKTAYQSVAGDYVRGALKSGLKIEKNVGVNPYKFGVIGSTDAHTSIASAEENNFWGKMVSDSIPEKKNKLVKDPRAAKMNSPSGWDMSASGLAAVWAEENTRDAIFAAFKRKEVYGTTGPRIKVRFFGGWGFDDLAQDNSNLATIGYGQGVPMGGDLTTGGKNTSAPEFLIHAVRDPKGANLDRLQVVKGWLDNKGEPQERVYNVAWSDERPIDEKGYVESVGDTVDRKTGKVDNTIGAPELVVKWRDPHFNASTGAFYYVRVLQIPTARHSLLDALSLGLAKSQVGPDVLQERAYTSPIWYTPQ